MRRRRAHQPERRAQVDVEHLVPRLVGGVLHRPGRDDAGGVDERGQPAERRDRLGHDLAGRARGRDVGLERLAPAACLLDFLSHLA